MEAQKTGLPGDILTDDELRRYARHLLVPEIGLEGQEKLKRARVLVVGAGGLGSPAVLYLAAAGVGTVGVVDGDRVEESNLQRQVVYETGEVGRPKVAAVRERISALNPLVRVAAFDTFLASANAMEIIRDFDVVVDGSDNFPARYLVNDACVLLHKPDVFGAVHRFEGQASVFGAENGPCYRCFFAEPPRPGAAPACAEAGVMGILPGVVGCIQATEAIKILLGGGDTLAGRLLLIDAWRMRFREVKIRRDPECPLCGRNPSIRGLIDYEGFCGVKRAGNRRAARHIGAGELKRLIEREPRLRIVEIREPHETGLVDLPNRRIMRLDEVEARRGEFDPADILVFACKIGVRSEAAVGILAEAGYRGRMYNLRGGIIGWIREMEGRRPGGGA